MSEQPQYAQVTQIAINQRNAAKATAILSTAQNDHRKDKRVVLGYVRHQGIRYSKAWFHASEIHREKLFMRNTNGWACLIWILSYFRFYSEWNYFYSLVKRIFSRIE